MTQTFETPEFRVQIVHRTVWVETRDDGSWTLRHQHAFPLPCWEELENDPRFTTLVAAVRDFETHRAGDVTLRAALVQARPKPAVVIVPKCAPPARSSPRVLRPRKEASFRAPLRPPLASST